MRDVSCANLVQFATRQSQRRQLEKTFISDNLTRTNQHIMYVARSMRKQGKLHSAWTDVGRMKIRLSEGGPTKIIRSLEDLYEAADPDRRAGAAPAAPAKSRQQ